MQVAADDGADAGASALASAATETTEPGSLVGDLVLAQAARTPSAAALTVGREQRTYAEVVAGATQVRDRLRAAGAGPGTVVAVVLDRSCGLVEALLGILLSGAAYVPIDARQPVQRCRFMLSDTAASLVLTRTDLLPAVSDKLPADLPVLLLDASPDADRPGPNPTGTAGRTDPARDDVAYILYTSGSTGLPKGVLVEQHNIARLVRELFPALSIGPTDSVLSLAAYTFDVSVGDIFSTLATGARLILPTEDEAADPYSLGALVQRSGATVMNATPTTWTAMLDGGWRGDRRLVAVAGGEPLTDRLARRLLEACAAVWNVYGPTETTVWSTVGPVTAGDTVTVGRALPGTQVQVCDAHGEPVPDGETGEIVISGAGVTRGYLNRPEEHSARFGTDAAGDQFYRTGDLGRVLADGRLQHLGRGDDQVKIRGYRLEPGEVEAVLAGHPEVRSCSVIARENTDGELQLVAYVIGTPEARARQAETTEPQPTAVELRSWVRERLPDYMVPSAVVHLDALPRTSSGKLDRRALPAPGVEHATQDATAPHTATEQRVAALWTSVLPAPVTDVHADFFVLGGDSLLAARLVAGLNEQPGPTLTVRDFLDRGTTVAGLAALLDGGPVPEPGEALAPLFCVYPDLPSAMSRRHLTRTWGAQLPVHALTPADPNGRFAKDETVEHLAEPMLATIRDVQPHGPYLLAGFSVGGLVAYELARRLSEAGEQVQWVGLLDAPAPTACRTALPALSLWARLQRLREHGWRHRLQKLREVPLRALRQGVHAAAPDEVFDIRAANVVGARYDRPGLDLPAELFVTTESVAESGDSSFGWRELHRGPLRVHTFVGDHASLLQVPHVEDMATAILTGIRTEADKGAATAQAEPAPVES
ncbi:amino acid adenylation domain-containing protein [Rhodococcus sp. X156]|uniref:amino acid adenylation domain-containing protein n=1 Tax=Rhodococcus sp. X156 TaxID=2499145 RepID=UPI0013E3EB78|nr:amino acid adenylation domain-containing protein [Rhodococcus sp. X156]